MEHPSQQNPQQDTPDLDWEIVVEALPSGWVEKARELGAFQRARKIRNPQGLLRLLLMHCGIGLSFQRTAEAAEYAQLARMAKTSIWERIQRVGPWLAWLISALLSQRVSAVPVAGYRPRLVDATTVNGPHNRTQQRVHYSLSLTSLTCDDLIISGVEQAESFERFAVSAGDLLLGDRVYAKAKGIGAVIEAGGDVIVRLGRTSLTLYDEAGAKINWLAWMRGAAPGELRERFAQFRDKRGAWITGRICAIGLDEQQAQEARGRCQKTARRKGSRLREATLEAAGYLCVYTTAPGERLSAEAVLELYRARWQVELSFKRLKSLLQADQLRETSAKAAHIWLQGKMLYALLIQSCLSQAESFSPRSGCLRPAEAEPCAVHYQGLGADGAGEQSGEPGDPALATGRFLEMASYRSESDRRAAAPPASVPDCSADSQVRAGHSSVTLRLWAPSPFPGNDKQARKPVLRGGILGP